MAARWVVFILICALGIGCAPAEQPGPFERIEEMVWKTVNRKHRGQDGIYLQATFHTFAYEIAKAYAKAAGQDLDQGQLESRLKELIYRHAISDYPTEDGTDINSLYFQYLIYYSPSFDPANPLQKKVFDNWTAQYVRQVLDKAYDRKFPMLRNHYDERWGLTLYSRLVFYIYLDNTDSDLEPRIDDIGERTFLVDDLGNRYRPSGLAGPYPNESSRPKDTHLKGKLAYPVFFPNRQADHKTPIVTPQSSYLQLEIEGLGEEKVRSLRWDLPLQYPEMPARRLPAAAEETAL
jgi:hypothetical protein